MAQATTRQAHGAQQRGGQWESTGQGTTLQRGRAGTQARQTSNRQNNGQQQTG